MIERAYRLVQWALLGSAGILVLNALFCMFIGYGPNILVFFAATMGLAASGIILVVLSVAPPTKHKLITTAIALSVGVGAIFARGQLTMLGARLFFLTRRAELEAFVSDLLAYGRIWEMCDGKRYFKELNGELITYEAPPLDASQPTPTRSFLYYRDVLARDSIDEETYESFRHRLQDIKLISVEVHEQYVAFVYDGMLDNLIGYVYVRSGNPPSPGVEFVDSTMLVALKSLGRGWYFFATT
ncbi:MAG TPA: hypothetical protein VF192_10775 [Longimicrobiales bacterium]